MTLFEKLKKANDDYHEAFDDVLKDDIVPVEIKVVFASYGNTIFSLMKKANEIIRNHYE